MSALSSEFASGDSIVRRSLHDELVERLQRLIIEGQLAPGEKVPEKELCARFAVSRTPLREALKVLASEGLITLTPNRGAWVTALTLEDLEEVFPVMGALEALAGEMAAIRISDEEIGRIRSLHQKMVSEYQRADLPAYFKLNQEIHESILNAAANATLSAQYRMLSSRVRRARYLANMSDERWAMAVKEHEEIIDALEARDGVALAAILKRHLANKFATVRDWLQAEEQIQNNGPQA
ncbi:MAG: GntR family transcriptional regulator [Kiloniellales bacterium]|nr:GntR family transcriptional regulator [Kiloniellales bacterium]